MRAYLALLLLVASCSPAKRDAAVAGPAPVEAADASTNEAPIDSSSPPIDTIDPPPATDAGGEVAVSSACPASYASGSGLCQPSGKACEYPEGTCKCAPQSYCGGVAPTPQMLAALAVPRWHCQPPPKKLGPDGCPYGQPTGKCSTPGKKCQYGDCCVYTVTCTNGTWVPGSPSCPP